MPVDEPILLDFDRSSLGDDPMIARHLIALPVLPSTALPPSALPIARRAWEERARSEYIGVMVVRRFHGLLVDLNAPMDLQELALAMLLQEQQHAALCTAAARALGSSGTLGFELLELQRPRTDAPVAHQLLEMVVSSYCVGEVVALALIQHSIDVLPPSPYRDILRRIARDEVLHGRLGGPLLALLSDERARSWFEHPGPEAARRLALEAIAVMRARDVVEPDEEAMFEDPTAADALLSVGIPPSPGFRARYHEALEREVPEVLSRAGVELR